LVLLNLRDQKPKERTLANMTECTTGQLIFSFFRKRQLTVTFGGGEITSDAGLLLIRQADNSLHLSEGIAGCITDRRDSRYADHGLVELLRQRIYQVVAGYEDCNDANLLRRDPALKAACDRLLSDDPLASQPTLSRLENSATTKDLYRMAEQFLQMYIRRNKKRKPKRIILDLDGTDDPTYGNQQLTFFHGYYDQYIYHPLVIYDADTGELVTAVLRAGNRHASYGAVALLKRIVPRLRTAFPKAQIIIRGDAGFAIPALCEYCEAGGLKYVNRVDPQRCPGAHDWKPPQQSSRALSGNSAETAVICRRVLSGSELGNRTSGDHEGRVVAPGTQQSVCRDESLNGYPDDI
jgi:hypothetical protein